MPNGLSSHLKSQSGSAAVLIILLLVAASVLSLGYLSQQASREYDAELQGELNADKNLVRSSLRWKMRCNAEVLRSCSLGDRIKLYDRQGKLFIDDTGTSTIGKWNVRIACDRHKEFGLIFHAQVARMDSSGTFLDDPLTKNKLNWRSIFPMRDICEGGGSDTDVVLRNDCYGNLSGRDPVSGDLLRFCPRCPSFRNFYCADDQINFPTCPTGFRVGVRYVDRYGWGGIDMTKITVCRKI